MTQGRQVQVIGVGLEGPASLTAELLEHIQHASLLVGSQRLLVHFPHVAQEQWQLTPVAETIERLSDWCVDHPDQSVVVLATGDPLFYGIGRLLLAQFDASQLTFHPHLSSVQLAFSRIKRPWANATIVSVHGRSLDCLMTALRRGDPLIAVLTDTVNSPQAIAQFVSQTDGLPGYQWWVCENLGGPDEQVRAVPLDRLRMLETAPLNILVLERADEERLPPLPLLGIPDQYFHNFPDRPGLMTKRENRILAIAELDLQPPQTIWDIGAGTGSVSIEIARLCPHSRIFAIEKTLAGYQLIQQNQQRFQTQNLQPILGTAPDVLANLPPPDRVFMGGSGGALSDILETVASRLDPQGLILLTLTTLENLTDALQWFNAHNWSIQLLQSQLSRATAIAHLHRWSPLNPVTFLKARSPNN